ncbi:2-amino-4-hydroxy-6-hydroxymethyldihydropteridine diphosphokinase [Falsibacillus albus]|uniref:2-amino-4-hydroxy-6-hydroxymethyldihydropteridine diphosphokinase n=1 Tax=Falsibacillus albus TaxID=2478915 RepID=A0A3L7JLP8_9BACI|nr:2-amino-4-hydroxy-6-hydroxymethyldihydropteridine diphosphokinase [Falsibacillus albus]RLQ91663.1 2-amino-4-hydroxy-6-hydroxymethyldihydropteridine diphosphokinase [Falsibacillus albus]
MDNIAYISLGSNMGDREAYLKKAMALLQRNDAISILAASSIYETDPVGYTEQGNFLNMAIKVETSFSAQELLSVILDAEMKLGRKREIKWGPRTIDLDILLYNNENIETKNLIIPHPRMHERAFVLVPLVEIEPDLAHSSKDTPYIQVLDEIPDKEGVRLWKQTNGEDVYELIEN